MSNFGYEGIQHIYDTFGPLFLDCGAYSAWAYNTAYTPDKIDSYLQFVHRYHHLCAHIAAPDVIGDFDKTKANFDYFMGQLSSEVDRSKILTTYHVLPGLISNFERTIEYSKEAGLEWLALGGGAQATNSVQVMSLRGKMLLWQEIIRIFNRLNRPVKIHFFGDVPVYVVRSFKPDSMDSASFIIYSAHFEFHTLRYKPLSFRKIGMSSKANSFFDIRDLAVKEFIKLRSDIEPYIDNHDVFKISYLTELLSQVPSASSIRLVNSWAIRAFENRIRKIHHYPFVHWMSISGESGRLPEYQNEFWRLLMHPLKNRSLVSYVAFDKDLFPSPYG